MNIIIKIIKLFFKGIYFVIFLLLMVSPIGSLILFLSLVIIILKFVVILFVRGPSFYIKSFKLYFINKKRLKDAHTNARPLKEFDTQVLSIFKKTCNTKNLEQLRINRYLKEDPYHGFTLVSVLSDGVVSKNVPWKIANKLFEKTYKELERYGYKLFLMNKRLVKKKAINNTINYSIEDYVFDVVLIKGRHWYDPILFIDVDGANYNIKSTDLVKLMKTWYEKAPFIITYVATDTVKAIFSETINKKMAQYFTKEIDKVAPDMTENGTLINETTEKILKKQEFMLWWD